MEVANYFVFYFIFYLYFCSPSRAQEDADNPHEFVHLIRRAGSSRQLHLISEIVQDGQRVQVEEFVDLNSYNQLIQVKWHSLSGHLNSGDPDKQGLSTDKINLLILNENGGTKFMYQYQERPFYQCHYFELQSDVDPAAQNDEDWRKFLQVNADTKGPPQLVEKIVESIRSKANNSPYLTKLNTTQGAAWLFGVSGLWLKASDESHAIRHLNDVWRLELAECSLIVDFYQESSLLGSQFKSVAQNQSNSRYDLVNLIDVKRTLSGGAEETFHLINIIDVKFHFSPRLAPNLFSLPIGFGCAQNRLINQSGLYFGERSSQEMEFEVIATKYNPSSSVLVENEMKTIEINQVKHPVDPSKHLFALHVREDQTKQIRDFHLNLAYFIRLNGTTESKCTTSHLTGQESIELSFKQSGLTVSMNKNSLDYLLASDETEQRRMRLLNIIESSELFYEYVFESQHLVERPPLVGLVDLAGRIVKSKVSIVRVFRLKAVGGSLGLPKRAKRRGLLELSRVIVIVFDEKRTRRLAELRFNLISERQTMSFARRANKFDLSKCYDLAAESMQLVASYPVDVDLVNHFRDTNSHQELIERFYSSHLSTNRLLGDTDNRLLAISGLNFLRVPKASLVASNDDQLELRLTVLDTIRPLDRFVSLDESSFEVDSAEAVEILLVGSLDECSQFCRQLSCKTFAFDAKHECKLSHLQLNQTDSIQVVPKQFSKLFYSPIEQADETSLSELASYIEHFANQLAEYEQTINDDDPEQSSAYRPKRSTKTSQVPFMSFDFVDRSGLTNEYSPPRARLLVPSQVNVIRFPLSMDVSSDQTRSIKVAESFRAQEFGRSFRLTSRGAPQLQEKTFVDKLDQVYYTLKRLESIEQQNCALVCLNINEWNRKTSSEQVCISFSYSRFTSECIMLIKTDFVYLDSQQDLPRVDVTTPEGMTSIDELLVEDAGSLLAKRDYLPEFDGPIRLSWHSYGYKSTDPIMYDIEHERGLSIDWLQIFQNEAPTLAQLEANKQDCPMRCLQRNKQQRPELCVAFDYCSRIYVGLGGQKRHQVSCNLLLVSHEGTNERRLANQLNWLRSKLSQLTHTNETRTTGNNSQPSRSECQRYLLSHLRDFNHLKQRQISEQSNDLIVPAMMSNELNLDSCALECHLQGSNKCLGFQYCLSVDRDTSNVQRNCSFLGTARPSTLTDTAEVSSENNQKIHTNYNKNCHIYLRNQFDSLDDILQFKPDEVGTPDEVEFNHWTLVVCFVVIYVALIAAFIVWYTKRRDSTIRQRISMTLAQINERSGAR